MQIVLAVGEVYGSFNSSGETTRQNIMKNTTITLTEMEKEVLLTIYLEGEGYEEGTIKAMHPEDLSDYTGIPMKILRGVIGSLVKKDKLFDYENDCFCIEIKG